jgi:tetratricopeptide (TPR) repeat protein/DNA-binding CsgD family transcriptional regulator
MEYGRRSEFLYTIYKPLHRQKELKMAFLRSFLSVIVFISFLLQAHGNEYGTIDSLKRQLSATSADTSQIHTCLLLAKAYAAAGMHKNDSAFLCLNKASQLSSELKNNTWLYEIYSENCALLSSSGNYSIALDYFFKMLKMLDEESAKNPGSLSTLKKYASLYSLIGNCYYNLDNNEKALKYFLKSNELCESILRKDSSFPYNQQVFKNYNNIGSVYLTNNDVENARIYYEKALEINKKLNNQVFYGMIYNNLGIVSKNRKDYAGAFRFYNKSLEIRKILKDTAGIAQVCNNLGDCYYLTGDYSKSIDILSKALAYSRQSANLSSQMKAANFLSLAYEKTGNYRLALENQRLYKLLYDSITNSNQTQFTAKLEMQYLFDKQQKENELQQQIELAKKQRKALIFMIISGVLLSSFIVLMLLNRNQKIKIKRNEALQESLLLESKNLALEKQNLELEKSNLRQELDFRNKELATHVMYLLKKNEFITSITEKLLSIKEFLSIQNKKWVQDIIREMKSNVDNTVWGEFEMRFQQVHEDFYNRLKEHFPDLTPNEKKLCAFLRLNMTTKEISSITFQSIKSIQVARTRLRKKMDITRDENLISYLQQL